MRRKGELHRQPTSYTAVPIGKDLRLCPKSPGWASGTGAGPCAQRVVASLLAKELATIAHKLMAPARSDDEQEVQGLSVLGNDGAESTNRARIYLVRHGRTELNAAGALRGHLDVALDPVGRQEAARLGRSLARRQLHRVVTSPLRRAIETGEAIAREAHVAAHIDVRLVDRDYGQWAGVPAAEVVGLFGSLDAAPGVEPATDVRARALEAMTDIARGSASGPTVVVGHDAINRTVLAALDPALGSPGDIPQDTGCLNTIECDLSAGSPVGRRVLSINEPPGLEGPGEPKAGGPESRSRPSL